MKSIYRYLAVGTIMTAMWPGATLLAQQPGETDPSCVVEKWSDASTSPKIIDINFSDTSWPDTWGNSGSGMQCPEFDSGVYVNAILTTPALGSDGVAYPVLFHNCTFATSASSSGTGGVTAAFARQFFGDQNPTNYNNWTYAGHTTYLEDNIVMNGSRPVSGSAGFVQMCRNKSADGVNSLHGWMEIDHIPYVERIQWSWSSTSWGRGIKCDIKVGDGDWEPLVWMGSEKQKLGWTVFSDQGYFMENVIDKKDVSLRWRVWDGDGAMDSDAQVQKAPFDWQSIDPLAQKQAPRVHKLKIFGDPLTAEQAAYAKANPVGNVGELTDLSKFGVTSGGGEVEKPKAPAPDDDAEITLLYVNQDGSGDYTTIQAAIDAVPDTHRGIIYIAPGVYDENVYAGTRKSHNKFISLIGSDAETTILTNDVNRGADKTKKYYDCTALNVYTPRFYAENLTIRNTSGNKGQAEALYTEADAHVFKDCILSGYQDTYKAAGGSRGYFKNCTISGATDFIYDSGLEWFEDCKIVCVKGGGYITAPADSRLILRKLSHPDLSVDKFRAGLFFRNCDVVAEDGVADGAYYLGRPWKEESGSMFINCRLGSHINRLGWKDWSGSENTASLFEYGNTDATGAPVAVDGRASFSHQATEAEVKAYMNPEFLFAKMSDVPFDFESILDGVAAPANISVTPAAITWDGDKAAVAYIVYCNGKFVEMTADTSFVLPDGAVSTDYSIAAVSRHGVTSEAVKVEGNLPTLAFPTAEGFGKFATGGRGGKVVKVTSLADDNSAGTLRWAFNQYKEDPITIVFEVSGEIKLASDMRVKRSNWTLAGQTAPGEGIVITRNKVNFGGSENFIVRNVRFRVGQKNMNGQINAVNALGAENCSNFIIDHCSFGWSVEENMNTADSHFLTVQYSIVHEGLYNAGHSKGARGYGCQWGGSPATYHHNLLAHNNSRSSRLNGARGEDYVVFMEYINNVNYNYGKRGGCYGGENTADISTYNGQNSVHECNFMNNYYKPGPVSDKSKVVFVKSSYARSGAKSWAPAKWFIDGNIAEGIASANKDNWTSVEVETYPLDSIRVNERIVTKTPWYKYSMFTPKGLYIPQHYMLYDIESADDAFKTVLEKAGTIKRDAVERRVIAETSNGTAKYGKSGIIDTENDVEGFFDYDTNYTVPVDSDGDGMPDEWEKANNLNPDVADNNLLNSKGYTALEVYLNSLMGELLINDFDQSGIEKVIVSTEAKYDSASHTLLTSAEAIGATLEVYGMDGRLMDVIRVNGCETSLDHLTPGFYLLRLSSDDITPVVLKIKR
ncbi:MAG: pectinesterase family protein [Bacteroides sp.]|nr:pectinesterase family protein [Bacteroides sp.]